MFHTTQKKSPKIHPKPFCKVCHDAGKSQAEYTSHFVKSEPGANGVVVCPTLLAQGCGFCHEFGHTVKYCMKLKNQQKDIKKNDERVHYLQRSERDIKKVDQKVKKSNSVFALLAEDSDDESKKVKKPKSNKKEPLSFPVLVEVKVKPITESNPNTNTKISYASMASKPAVPFTPCEPNYPPPPKTVTVATIGDYITKASKARMPMKNWADWSDSEDEAEEDKVHVSYEEVDNGNVDIPDYNYRDPYY